MKPRCRLCGQRTVEDSIFCIQHRDQAQRFSLSFGKQEDGEDEPPAKSPDPAAAKDPDAAGPGSEPATAPPTMRSEAELEEERTELDQERAVLAAAFHPAFDELRTRLHDQADPLRWPQLSLYFLDDALHCRAYFSILPHDEDEVPAPMFALDEDRVHAALAADGIVFGELYARYREYTEALREQSLQTLDVHFLTYAGLIAINGHPPGRKMQNLATLKLVGNEFRKVELDEDARALMRHDHW